MLRAKFQEYRTAGSGEEFLKVFTIYRHGGHPGDLDHLSKLSFSLPKEAQKKIWL